MPPDVESREEQALREAGRTEVSPAAARFTVFCFLLLIVGVPVWDQAASFLAWRQGDDEAPAVLELAGVAYAPSRFAEDWRNGGLLKAVREANGAVRYHFDAFGKGVEERSAAGRAVRPWVNEFIACTLRGGKEDVYIGRNGYLFYRAGIDYAAGPPFLDPAVLASRIEREQRWHPAPQPDPVKAIVELHDALKSRGIALVVLPVPDKAAIYPEHFSARYGAEQAVDNPSYGRLLGLLRDAGIFVCDAAAVLREAKAAGEGPLFLASDTHWTPAGMRRVAGALADVIREAGVLTGAAPKGYAARSLRVAHSGDLVAMLGLRNPDRRYAPEPVEISQVYDPEGTPWRSQNEADVLLLGDSFANMYSQAALGWGEAAGLSAHLSLLLQRPAEEIAINGRSAYAARLHLHRQLASGIDRLAGKRVVIFEFAARELAVGDWKIGFDYALGTPPQ